MEGAPKEEKNPLKEARARVKNLIDMLNLIRDGHVTEEKLRAYIQGADEDLQDLKVSLGQIGQ